ncbi:MAG: hypothetical protein ABFC34_13805 [Methanobacterium sp.]
MAQTKSDLTTKVEQLQTAIAANTNLTNYQFQSYFGVGDLSTLLQQTKSGDHIINNITSIDNLEITENNSFLDYYGAMIVMFTKTASELNIPDQLILDFKEIESILETLEYLRTTPEIGFDGTNYFITMQYGSLKG